jgi:hypothetical protein
MKGVKATYIRYEAAGDQYVGRTVSGLPMEDERFTLLPPYFTRHDNVLVRAMNISFPGIPSELRRVAQYRLASVIYHLPFLRNTLPDTHTLFKMPLFRERDMIETLSTSVVCVTARNSDVLRVTGIYYYYNKKSTD